MSLRGLVHRDVKTIGPMTTLIDAAEIMRRFKIGSVCVEENGSLIGIVTEGDIVRKGIAQEIPFETPACVLMNAPLIEIDIEKSVIEANHLMRFSGIRHLAISEKGRVIGIISVRDLVLYFSSDKESPLNALGDIIKPLTVLVHRDIQTIDLSASAREAARKMDEKKIGSLVVMDKEVYIGMVTETDMICKVVGDGRVPSQISVGAIMNTPILNVDINASIREANRIMATQGVRHLGVTEGGRLIGVLSIRDLIGMISIRDLPRFFAAPK